MKKPGRDRATQRSVDDILAQHGACPGAPDCRRHWRSLPGRGDVAHYYQWLERSTLAEILEAAS